MKIYLKDGNYALAKDFPMNVFEIRDTLDRLRKFQSREVSFRLSEFDNMELPQSLCGKEFSADIYKLNLFAERYEKLKYPETAAFKSLLKANPDSSFDDMLLMSYGLDPVPVFPCEDLHELGEMAIENDMLCELEDCSDEMLELLDREHIGQIMCERDGGMFVDGYYCVPSCYERPDMNIELYHDFNGDGIFSDDEQLYKHEPDELQWWITGFDPLVQNVKAEDLQAVTTIDFSSFGENKDIMLDSFREFNAGEVEWDIPEKDSGSYIVTLTW